MGSLGGMNGDFEGAKPMGSLVGINGRDHWVGSLVTLRLENPWDNWAGSLGGITGDFEGGKHFGISFLTR